MARAAVVGFESLMPRRYRFFVHVESVSEDSEVLLDQFVAEDELQSFFEKPESDDPAIRVLVASRFEAADEDVRIHYDRYSLSARDHPELSPGPAPELSHNVFAVTDGEWHTLGDARRTHEFSDTIIVAQTALRLADLWRCCMALPKLPGKSYREMYELIDTKRLQLNKQVFTNELLVAICWEETFFNNIKQEPGTAVGFGQTEPSEFWKLETPHARAKGFFVPGLPRRHKVKEGVTTLLGKLTDEQSVQVLSALLCQLYFDLSTDVQTILQAVGGVGFSRNMEKAIREGRITKEKAQKTDPLGVAGRLAIIARWRECERILLKELPATGDRRPKIREALNAAKPFFMNDPDWNKVLFPEDDQFWMGK